MNIKEVATMFGVKEKNNAMRNKQKAKEIMGKILKCHKCGSQMNWIEGTNVCVCPTCTYSVKKKGKNETKEVFSVSKTLQEKSRKFLENNYQYITEKESTEV